jgi:hypothetical protein
MTTIDGTLRLRATLEPRGPAAAIVLTDEQVAMLGAGKVFPVQVTVGAATVATRVARMGGENLVGLSRKLRAELGVETGDVVDVVLAADTAPREVVVPPALAAALTADPTAETAFEALAPSHRREFARWIDEARRDDTRKARVEQTLQMLREGKTRR